ncbi:zinc finger MYM-type protein 1-like isoform X1 [Brassica napus]|uniref:zinc finger MYM-type protein 1-like isoform X1 n=1 Tax=Brassica napus TaxID=3708 RepID=UPI002078AC68|nr:zinc finger MYM-type protein 1-like isoform X1 [Brassica napus]
MSEDELEKLPYDPGERKRISEYPLNQRDEVIRKYLIRGPCQPRGHEFPKTLFTNKLRRFNPSWFDLYGDWLEYSVKKDKAYCLFCYLFRDYTENKGGSDAFVITGFDDWNKTERLQDHVGAVNSFHNSALKRADYFMRPGQSIVHAFYKQDDAAKNEYRIRLNASIGACRFLLQQGLPFRGHDESVDSVNKGNFLALLKYTAEQNELVSKVVLENAPKNNQMVSHKIQTDIVHCFAEEVIESVIQEVGHDIFCLLVDESADVSDKEQMAVVFRFVDNHGIVKERFIGLVHVKETSSLSLKCAVDLLFAKYGLSMKKLRGQGYDGASNMKGEFNGLRSLIMRECSSAYYVHCFAHQLQLVVVAVAQKHFGVVDFFDKLAILLNVVGASCKRKDMVREDHLKRIEERTKKGEMKTGKGLNQEVSFQRPGKTRWGSHYKTLLRLVDLFPSIITVLEYVEKDGSDAIKRRQANGLLNYFHTFEFALQRKDLDILNAMSLVKSTKQQLNKLRENGWESLINKVFSFCKTYKTELLEFNDRFDEVNTELLGCIASLSPNDSFREFDHLKVMRLSEFYPEDFSHMERMTLEHQLGLYIDNIREDERFANLKNLGDLACMMVETKKHLSHPLVYRLLKLVLTLPVATATVERCFSAMKIVKTSLRNRISDQFLNDCVICFVEKELFEKVTNDAVIKRFQKMESRRINL